MEPGGKNLKRISDLDTERGLDRLGTGLLVADLRFDGQEALTCSIWPTESPACSLRARWACRAGAAFSPDSKWVSFSKQDETLRTMFTSWR